MRAIHVPAATPERKMRNTGGFREIPNITGPPSRPRTKKRLRSVRGVQPGTPLPTLMVPALTSREPTTPPRKSLRLKILFRRRLGWFANQIARLRIVFRHPLVVRIDVFVRETVDVFLIARL